MLPFQLDGVTIYSDANAIKKFKVQSQVCAGEQWTATAADQAVTLALSHLSDRRAVLFIDGSNLIKPTYKIKPIDL